MFFPIIKISNSLFQFEFSKTENQRIFLYFKTQQGAKIMDQVLENLRFMGIDYSINKKASNIIEKEMNEKNAAQNESKLLPRFEILDKSDNKEESDDKQQEKIEEHKIDEDNDNIENNNDENK